MDEEATADDIIRGLGRAFADADCAVLPEMALANGRRADLVAVDRHGTITLVEVKSSRTDFLTDQKWPEYLDYCDRFYFAVGRQFPQELLPADEGLILADRFGAATAREATRRSLSGARRKAMLIRFGRAAAKRLQVLLDPVNGADRPAG